MEFLSIFPTKGKQDFVFSSYFCNWLSFTYKLPEDWKMLAHAPVLISLFPTKDYHIFFPFNFYFVHGFYQLKQGINVFIPSQISG